MHFLVLLAVWLQKGHAWPLCCAVQGVQSGAEASSHPKAGHRLPAGWRGGRAGRQTGWHTSAWAEQVMAPMLKQAPTCRAECAPRDLRAVPPAPCTTQHLTQCWSGPGMDSSSAADWSPSHTQACKHPFGPWIGAGLALCSSNTSGQAKRMAICSWDAQQQIPLNAAAKIAAKTMHLDMGTTSRESSPVCGLWLFCLTIPGSTTKTTPSTVTLVSAILVATTTRRQPAGPGANTLACRAAGAGWSWSAKQQAQPDAGLEPARNITSNDRWQQRGCSDTEGCRKRWCHAGGLF